MHGTMPATTDLPTVRCIVESTQGFLLFRHTESVAEEGASDNFANWDVPKGSVWIDRGETIGAATRRVCYRKLGIDAVYQLRLDEIGLFKSILGPSPKSHFVWVLHSSGQIKRNVFLDGLHPSPGILDRAESCQWIDYQPLGWYAIRDDVRAVIDILRREEFRRIFDRVMVAGGRK